MHKAQLTGNIRRVAYSLILLLVALLVYISYIQIIERDFYTAHPLNRRSAEYAKNVARGAILDRNGQSLAISEKKAEGGFKRIYPYGPILAHLVGYDSVTLGKSGIESSFNGYLSGLDNPGQGLGAIGRLLTGTQAYQVVLTIDAGLQKAAYQALGDRRGAIIVLEPHSGAILAMVSKPGFDPNTLEERWNELSGAAASPLLNRAVNGLYPPGSIIKPLFAEAWLAQGPAVSGRNFDCTGSLKIGSDYILQETNRQAHGEIDLSRALAVSCNIAFAQIALELGNHHTEKVFERFGFEKSTGADLQETASRLPDFSGLGDGDLAQTGIGQGSLLVTPLRMAMLAATFANQGVTMRPYVVSKVTTADGSIIKNYAPVEWRHPTDAARAAAITAMMVKVVEEGTGRAAGLPGIRVAGKTGTAENPHGADHAWFIGFAPAQSPQVVIAVIVENGGAGGGVAAPLARQVLDQALR